jgi:hypothetical protein
MRAMPRWQTTQVAGAGNRAANEPLSHFLPRREVLITRLGAYTRVVLTKRADAPTRAG